MSRITASVVTYRTEEAVLQKCLSSLLATSLPVKAIVVDNSPTDRLRETASNGRAEYRWSGKNLGFGAGHNAAIVDCLNSSTYHVIVNPDVYFGGGVLEELIGHLKVNPGTGLIMPRVLYPDGSHQHLCKLLPTPSDLLLRRVFSERLQGILRRRTERYELRNADLTQIRSVPVLSGCFMLLRTEVFRTVGMFDDRFFMYMEDVDLCRRIHGSFDVVYYPHVSVFHEYAKGSYKHWKLTKHHFQSACRYFNKWGWFHDPERESINKRALLQLAGHSRPLYIKSKLRPKPQYLDENQSVPKVTTQPLRSIDS